MTEMELTIKETKCLGALRKYVESDYIFKDLDDVLTDEFLLAFVRGRKCDIQKTTKTLHTYIRLRREDYRDYFQSFIPSTIKHAFETPVRVTGILKSRDSKGRYVGMDRIGIWDPDWIDAEKGAQVLLFYGMEAMKLPQLQKDGLVLIVDFANIGLKHARCVSYTYLRMFSSIFVDSMPIRYREIHIVNSSMIADAILTTIKLFLSRKLRNRIQVHRSLESLHQFLSPEILPESLGGPLSDEEAFDSKFEQNILDNEEYYVQLAKKW